MGTKICTRCGEEKDLAEGFYASQGARCKACIRATSKAWARANPEKNRAKHARWGKANPEKIREKNKKYYQENKQAHNAASLIWARANPEKRKEYRARWAKVNSEAWRGYVAKRKSLKLAYEGPHFTSKDVVALLELQGGACSYCAGPINTGYHIDHVVPLSRGGGNGRDNIALACPSCNLSKGSKLLVVEWLPPCIVNFPLTGIVT